MPKPSNPSDSTILATIGCMQALTKCPLQLEHWLRMQNEQVASLSTSLKRSRAETACLNKEMMRQFAHFKNFRSSHSQVLTILLWKCMLVHRDDVRLTKQQCCPDMALLTLCYYLECYATSCHSSSPHELSRHNCRCYYTQ